MKILVTGGTGYIGSHTVVELLEAGHDVVIVDNVSNSSVEPLKRIEVITGKKPIFYNFDLQDKAQLDALFSNESFDAVIHFAGLKAVGESVEKPLLYYRTNLDASLNLLEVMKTHNVTKLVFSSSATVYGSAPVPYTESYPAGHDISSPYGQTKYMIEQFMIDGVHENPENEFTILRYFNPVGAHSSGLIGEDPKGVPNNLMPFIAQVAAGKRDHLSIFGNDYDTPDGTCVRDYIHVVDLAKGHVAALMHSKKEVSIYNLGSGKGTTVLELVKAFELATSKKVPYTIEPRRAGDLPAFYANVELAEKELDWRATATIEEMCADTCNWQSKNPDGYATRPDTRIITS